MLRRAGEAREARALGVNGRLGLVGDGGDMRERAARDLECVAQARTPIWTLRKRAGDVPCDT